MGVEILRLDESQGPIETPKSVDDLAHLEFNTFHVPDPAVHFWLMSTNTSARIFPQWNFSPADEEYQTLQRLWSVKNEQNLFDCLFLFHFAKWAKPNLYAVFSGYVRGEGWPRLRDTDKTVFNHGQSCIYRLDGGYDGKLNINWVPFYSAQSLVRHPEFEHLWRIFCAGQQPGKNNTLCLFGLSNPRLLPDIVQLLINKDDQRSMKLMELVDWFGMFSSPKTPASRPCAVVYSKNTEVIHSLDAFQTTFQKVVTQAQKELFEDMKPRTAIRIVSRHVVL